MRALATYALDEPQGARLGRAITATLDGDTPTAPLVPFKLGIVSNSTVDLLVPLLVASAARHCIALTVVTAAFGQITQQAFDPDSTINAARPDAVLLALDHRALNLSFTPTAPEEETAHADRAAAYLEALRRAFTRHCGAFCILQTVAEPAERLFGSYDVVAPGCGRRVVARVNLAIIEMLRGTPDLLLDVAGLAATVGLATWHSPARWNLAKLACDMECAPLYAEHVARLLAATRGRSRKCLVLDLDNTVWGGVIGDDGLAGIQVAQGDAVGEAHLDVQRWALRLRERGIVLAVC